MTHRELTLGEQLQARGVSRRAFMKYCATTASLLALPPALVPQIAHAMERLKGVEALMTTLPGQSVFPDGKDLSRASATQRQSVLHGA